MQGLCLVTMSLFYPLVAAMLESEPIQGLSSSCPPGHRRSSAAPAYTLPELLQQLGSFRAALDRHGLAPSVGHQALRQLLFLVSGTTLNYLLLRKDTCSWSRGIQLRSVPVQGQVYLGELGHGPCLPLTWSPWQVQHQPAGAVAAGRGAAADWGPRSAGAPGPGCPAAAGEEGDRGGRWSSLQPVHSAVTPAGTGGVGTCCLLGTHPILGLLGLPGCTRDALGWRPHHTQSVWMCPALPCSWSPPSPPGCEDPPGLHPSCWAGGARQSQLHQQR